MALNRSMYCRPASSAAARTSSPTWPTRGPTTKLRRSAGDVNLRVVARVSSPLLTAMPEASATL